MQCVARFYWAEPYLFAIHVLAVALAPMLILSVPYEIWLDRTLTEPRDDAWHFGALLLGFVGFGHGVDRGEVARHARAWATLAFGLRFSNLIYRAVLTNGPYRFCKHPAYLSKNLFWWTSTLPMLATTHSPVDAIRNTVILAAVSTVYWWRAQTEEAHLSGEDPKYRAYSRWMADHGLITAPLTRLSRRLTARMPAAPQPAE